MNTRSDLEGMTMKDLKLMGTALNRVVSHNNKIKHLNAFKLCTKDELITKILERTPKGAVQCDINSGEQVSVALVQQNIQRILSNK